MKAISFVVPLSVFVLVTVSMPPLVHTTRPLSGQDSAPAVLAASPASTLGAPTAPPASTPADNVRRAMQAPDARTDTRATPGILPPSAPTIPTPQDMAIPGLGPDNPDNIIPLAEKHS